MSERHEQTRPLTDRERDELYRRVVLRRMPRSEQQPRPQGPRQAVPKK